METHEPSAKPVASRPDVMVTAAATVIDVIVLGHEPPPTPPPKRRFLPQRTGS
jgi:hypothetical protein